MRKTVSTGVIHKPFLTDVQTLRDHARSHLDTGNVTQSYQGDVTQAIAILQSVLATEIVCVLRYTMHAVAATGISSEGVKAEFAQHAKEEQMHMMAVAERINQLGGTPNFNPEGLLMRSASPFFLTTAVPIPPIQTSCFAHFGKPKWKSGLPPSAIKSIGKLDQVTVAVRELATPSFGLGAPGA